MTDDWMNLRAYRKTPGANLLRYHLRAEERRVGRHPQQHPAVVIILDFNDITWTRCESRVG